MHTIEPHWNWRNLYTAESDPNSPFYGRVYSEFEFSDAVYDHLIHPQWDNFGSSTLFAKILFTDYEDGYVFIELMGEWNDLLYNDIMYFKREVIDLLSEAGINKFVLIGENVLNFHGDNDAYYEEWFDEVEDGWICLLNFRDHVLEDFSEFNIDHYFLMGGKLQEMGWRTFRPLPLFQKIDEQVQKRLAAP